MLEETVKTAKVSDVKETKKEETSRYFTKLSSIFTKIDLKPK